MQGRIYSQLLFLKKFVVWNQEECVNFAVIQSVALSSHFVKHEHVNLLNVLSFFVVIDKKIPNENKQIYEQYRSWAKRTVPPILWSHFAD